MLDVVNADRLGSGSAEHRGAEPAEGVACADPIAAARGVSARLFDGASEGDATGRMPQRSLAALHESGLALAPLPASHGGTGLIDSGHEQELQAVLRLIGAGDLSVARLYEGHVNAVALVRRYGTDDQLSHLAALVRGGRLSGVWNAEGARPLLADRHGEHWRLHGEKILASGAGLAMCPIVTPRVGADAIMLILDGVEPARVDLSRWTPRGMRASATGTVNLDGLTVSDRNRIGEPGDYPQQPMFSGGAWRFCAVHLGAAERLLDLFRAQLRARARADDPFQKQRVATATAACLTARLWIGRAATLMAQERDTPQSLVAFVNLTRTVTERACLDVIEAVERGIGLGAFMQPQPIERIARDLATYLRQPVPDLAMADAAAAVLAADAPTFDLWAS